MTAAAAVIPVMIVIIIAHGLYKRVDVFSEFAAGARENLTTCAELLGVSRCWHGIHPIDSREEKLPQSEKHHAPQCRPGGNERLTWTVWRG